MVDCTGLENRRPARDREFESHLFRQLAIQIKRLGAFFIYTYQKTYQTDRWLGVPDFWCHDQSVARFSLAVKSAEPGYDGRI